MDSADQDPPSSRPKRDLRLPEHLAEYDVVLLPSQQPAAQVSSLPVGQPGKRKPSRTGSASGYQSSTSSRRSSRLSLGSQLLKNMPDVKAAALEEQIRVMELADLQQEIEEEREADLEAKKLEEQVKEGQRMQEEAYLAKERMAKEMGRRRRLKKLEKEIKIASAVKCFLSESEDEAKDRLFHLPMLLSIQHSHSSTQIRQLVQSELGSILNSPAIKSGDAEAFDSFALSVQSLVSMLRTLEGTVGYELRCGSHVDRLLSKMSPAHRDGFVEYCLCRGILQPGTDITYTLPDLAAWLQMKAQAKRLASRATHLYNPGPLPSKREQHGSKCKDRAASVFLCSETTKDRPTTPQKPQASKFTPYCPFCNNKEHYLNSCLEFKKLNLSEIKKWIQEGDRCFKCGRNHKAAACTLKRPCKTCKETHLTVLHDVIQELSQRVLTVSHREPTVYIEQPRSPQRVLLKIVKVLLQHGNRTLETFAVLDDGSERSILLPHAVEQLQLIKHPETLHLRTVQQEVKELHGSSVSFHVSPIFKPNKRRSLHPPTLLPRQPASVRRQSERMTREIVSRLERDLPVFRQWEEEFYDGNESIRQGESGPSKMPTALITSCPDTTSQRASASGQTTTQVTIIYPSQTLTRVCGPEEDPIVKFIVLRRWKEAATHALKHQDLQEKLKEGVIKLICKECEVLCSRKNDFMLWKSKPEDLKSFSFNSLRDDLHRLAPFLLSIFNCISNDNKLAACTAAAVAIRGREPRLAALSYWINTILQFGRAKKSVFNRLSQLSLTTSHNKAVKKRHELALCCGAEFVQLKGGLKATETEEPQNLEDVRQSGCQTLFPSPSLNVNQDIPETSQIKEEPEEQCIKQEEEQLQEPVVEPKVECVKIEPSMFQQTEDSMEIKEEDINADSSEPGNYEPMVECVKIEPSMFQQTEDSKEIKGEDINADSSEPGNHDDWRSSLSCADVEMEADGEDFHKDQITAESMTAHNTSQSSNFQSAAETSAAVNPGDLCTEARGEGKKRYQALVTARLSAAAEDIFALFERTIADYEKELRLCKEKLRRQEQLETLRPRVRTPGVQMPSQSPDLSLNQTSPVKQERAEQSVRREPVLDSSVEGEDINADSEDWRTSFSCSDVQKEADGNGVQVAAHSTTAQNSGLLFNYKSAAEASVPVNTEDMSAEAQGDDERKYQCDVYGAAPTEHKPFS
uniref:Uncharacterized protein n=1 Tax=Knipowitschia caucasica TaxID=637954 RepID=A0AAV2M4Z4_KNICA